MSILSEIGGGMSEMYNLRQISRLKFAPGSDKMHKILPHCMRLSLK